MSLTSKERSALCALAAKEQAIFQLGKEGISDALIQGLSAALQARELIKISVLKSADGDKRELADSLSDTLSAETVKVIGNKIILYRRSDKKDVKHIL